MAKRAYLVLNVSYLSGIYIDYICANDRLLFSNIRKDKLLAYIDRLQAEDRQLIRMPTWHGGRNLHLSGRAAVGPVGGCLAANAGV